MKESTTYQEIVKEGIELGREEGRIEEARSVLLRLGAKQLGRPSAAVKAKLTEVANLRRLEILTNSLIAGSAKTWAELLRKAM